MFFSFKLRSVIVFLLILLIGVAIPIGVSAYAIVKANSVKKVGFTIVLDAGHGGMDGGSVGVNTGMKESDLNLAIVKKLERYLTNVGFDVVLTRKDTQGLYKVGSKNQKIEDMEVRKKIIEKASPNLVVSIHMNSFPVYSEYGAQAFFQQDNEFGKLVADTIQKQLIRKLGDNARSFANAGDYYMLNSTAYPSVLVECGYLSNPAEEALLITDEYQEQVAYAIMCGIFACFNIQNN